MLKSILASIIRVYRLIVSSRRRRSAVLSRMVHDLGAGEASFLCRSALWAGRSTMAQGRLSRRWNLDLVLSGRDLMVLRVDRSPTASPDDVESESRLEGGE
jgi:hypothetical protein